MTKPSRLPRRPLAPLALTMALAGCDGSTDPVPPPLAPAGPSATALSNTRIEVAWGDPGGDPGEYRVERAPGEGPFAPLTTLPDTVMRLVDAGLEPSSTYRYRVLACNVAGCSSPSPTVSATTLGTLAVPSAALPAAVEGRPYATELEAHGGRAPRTWSLVGGSLPPGLTLSEDGRIAGTPGTAGHFGFTVRVESEDGQATTRPLTLEVVARLVVTTGALPNAERGEAYNAAVHAEGGRRPHTWRVSAGSLPAGLSLSENGIISGIPDTDQTATFTLQVRGDAGQTAASSFTLRVSAPSGAGAIVIETALLPTGLEGAPYAPELTARGGEGTVTWSVVGGALPPGVTLSSGGLVEGAPAATGTFAVTIRAASGGRSDTRTYEVRVVPHRPEGFDLTRMDVVAVSDEIGAHVDEAIARWEGVLAGDLPAAEAIPRGFFSDVHCGGFGDAVNGTSVDDLLVLVDIAPIDGPGSTLGRAGPCGLRDASLLPFAGTLTLDADDLEPLVGTQALTDIVFHEIGHILGFGTLWETLDLVAGSGTADPTFTGAAAAGEFQDLGGAGGVPLEAGGGEGTAEGHWSEAVFDTEIMTGFSERLGVPQPLSRVTISSLADMGYPVDLDAADPYELPGGGAATAAPVAPGPGWDVAGIGPVRVLPVGPGGSR